MAFFLDQFDFTTGEYYAGDGVYLDLTDDEISNLDDCFDAPTHIEEYNTLEENDEFEDEDDEYSRQEQLRILEEQTMITKPKPRLPRPNPPTYGAVKGNVNYGPKQLIDNSVLCVQPTKDKYATRGVFPQTKEDSELTDRLKTSRTSWAKYYRTSWGEIWVMYPREFKSVEFIHRPYKKSEQYFTNILSHNEKHWNCYMDAPSNRKLGRAGLPKGGKLALTKKNWDKARKGKCLYDNHTWG